jgi:hypothetical protein
MPDEWSATRKLASDIANRIGPVKFYKRGSQEKHHSWGWIFSDFPARAIEEGFVLASCPRDLFFHPSGFILGW